MRISDWSSDVCSSDLFDLDASGWSISKKECAGAYDALAPDLRDALNLAAERIRAYHAAQLPQDRDYRDTAGVRLGARWNAVDAAGVYVPGGRAAYPSSVLMNIIPAKVAGVERIVMMTPTPGGEIRSEEHTSELQSIMRNSYSCFLLKKK